MVTRMSAEPKGQKRGVRIVLAFTLTALLALPTAAHADSFRGKTSQRRMASLVVGDDGFVSRIRISDSAPCTDPRYRYPNVLRIEPPFDEATTEAVTEEVVLRERSTAAAAAVRRRPSPRSATSTPAASCPGAGRSRRARC